ncbi:MAG: chemotaxis protein CheW [Halobacteria archaeon]|nr:chemotaxis protein CheW [Halobacteria archaeon]
MQEQEGNEFVDEGYEKYEEYEDWMQVEDPGVNIDGEIEDVEMVRVLEFVLGGDTYAIEVTDVSSIVEMSDITVTRLPRSPDAIDGVTDMRGEITAVLDLRKLLEVDEEHPSKEFLLVLDWDDDRQKMGLRADDVLQVEAYAEGRIDYNAELDELESRGVSQKMIQGLIRKPTSTDGTDGNDEDESGIELVCWLDIENVVSKLGVAR